MKLSELRLITFIFLSWQLIILLGFKLGSLFFYRKADFSSQILFPDAPSWLLAFANFDGVHYLSIAKNGYYQFEQAFFPLFPLVIKLFTFLTNNSLISGLLISHVFFFLSLVVAYKLFRLDFNYQQTTLSLIFLIFFPTSFFAGSVFTESLFLFLLLSSFLALRHGKWWLASILAGLASLTKFMGIFIWSSFVYEWWCQKSKFQNRRSRIWSLLSTFLIPMGLFIYMFYLKLTVNDPLAFIHVQPFFGANRSGNEIILLPQVLFRYLKIFIYSQWNYQYFIALLEFMVFIFGAIGLIILWKKKIRTSYLIFTLFSLIVPTLTGTLNSIPRYIFVAFPLFLLPIFMEDRIAIFLTLIYSLSFLLIFGALFTAGYWVA